MKIVENSYYDHDEHGRVKVVNITNGVVSMEKQEEYSLVNNRRIPVGVKQPLDSFREDAKPADVKLSMKSAAFGINGLNQ